MLIRNVLVSLVVRRSQGVRLKMAMSLIRPGMVTMLQQEYQAHGLYGQRLTSGWPNKSNRWF